MPVNTIAKIPKTWMAPTLTINTNGEPKESRSAIGAILADGKFPVLSYLGASVQWNFELDSGRTQDREARESACCSHIQMTSQIYPLWGRLRSPLCLSVNDSIYFPRRCEYILIFGKLGTVLNKICYLFFALSEKVIFKPHFFFTGSTTAPTPHR